LLLSAVRAGRRHRLVAVGTGHAPSNNGAAAWRSAANAPSVMLTGELKRLETDFLVKRIHTAYFMPLNKVHP